MLNNVKETKNCCQPRGEKLKGLLPGVLYGLLPHSFCIAFVIFSVIGATAATTVFKKFLLIPNFFEILVGVSFFFATLSAIIYFRRKNQLSVKGVKGNLGYLGILFGTTIAVNLLFFFVIFPAVANLKPASKVVLGNTGNAGNLKELTVKVQIPCSGRAPLIIDELKKNPGVGEIKFQLPSQFVVSYDSSKTNPEEILSAEIFKSFPVVLN